MDCDDDGTKGDDDEGWLPLGPAAAIDGDGRWKENDGGMVVEPLSLELF